ncbi:uncharacterized protein LOC110238776 [Exaiptasia diaphana]|uniref:Uncharacterized protein n=1 Tax=Exaiptasia diaphana TaxID=2652724 RepID=A0A913X8M1_EXADI|nr:uncharacterized protein LOC110238776 [Exaiptasia diaphana]KXJ14524.1 hypothetical protein AC249_AIPGENE26776 [Exaiptasia diaphana]
MENKVDQLSRETSRPVKHEELSLQKLKEAIAKQTELQLKRIAELESMKTNDIFTRNLIVHHGSPEKDKPSHKPGLTDKEDSQSFIQTLRNKFRMQRSQENENSKRRVSDEPGVAIGKPFFSQTRVLRDFDKTSMSHPGIKFTYLIPFDKGLSLEKLINLSPLLDEATMIDDTLMEYFIRHAGQLFIVFDGFDECKEQFKIVDDVEDPSDIKTKIRISLNRFSWLFITGIFNRDISENVED